MKWLNIMIRPPQPIVLVPKVSLIEKFRNKFLILEGEPSAPKFIYIAYVVNIPPNEVCASKTVPAMHDMTQNHVQTPSAHCFGPKGFTKWKILKKFDAKGWTKRSEVYVYSNNHTKWSLKPCLQCMKWLNIMIRHHQPIVLVPKISPSEKFFKNFDASGWT